MDALKGRYSKSEALLKQALELIPLGTQTFSKSKTQFPHGVSPFYVTHGKGCRLWDVDGNEYIDLINSLAAITLGYNDPDVTRAVTAQLEQGTIFSLPHPIEIRVAKLITELVPCAEQVRFGKNGTDATSAAIRLARAATGRERVAVCGYHGWQDWYIGSTSRNLGVPNAVRNLTHPFKYNDLESLRTLLASKPGEFAAIILEPANVELPKEGFLKGVADLANQSGALLVFDETITGFRYAKGGAQELFGIVPDLATFGKGVANGYPLSVIAGKAKWMKLMEEIFFSGTFGGETLSLAAAEATLTKLKKEPVINTLRERGEWLMSEIRSLLGKHKLQDVVALSGHPSWSFLTFKDSSAGSQWELKTLFLQEVFARGVLTLGTHNLCYAHKEVDLKQVISVYNEVFEILSRAIGSGSIRSLLRCEPLVPLFKVR